MAMFTILPVLMAVVVGSGLLTFVLQPQTRRTPVRPPAPHLTSADFDAMEAEALEVLKATHREGRALAAQSKPQ